MTLATGTRLGGYEILTLIGSGGLGEVYIQIDPQAGAGVPFDVTADGQRLLVNARIPSRLSPSLNVVVNWPALMEKP